MLGAWGMLPHPAGKGSSLINGMGHKEVRSCLLGFTLTKRPGLVCKEGVCGVHSGPGVCTEVKGMFNHVCVYIWGQAIVGTTEEHIYIGYHVLFFLVE